MRQFPTAFALSFLALCLLGPRDALAGAWRETPVTIKAHDGVVLAGSVLSPEGRADAPGVVILAGSGGNGRDGRIQGFPAYRVIAERLAVDGVAVMITDRRGVGGSGGRWRGETIEGRAQDAVLMLRRLAQDPAVDPRRIGVLGHSQGGWVATEAAAQAPDAVAFVVLMAGPGQSVLDQVVTDQTNQWRLAGRSRAGVAVNGLVLRAGLSTVRLLPTRCGIAALETLCGVIHYSPAAALPTVRAPVLALFGARDSLVPSRPNAGLLSRGLREADLTVRTFDEANHQFWKAGTGATAEYPALTPGYVPGFLDTISDWVLAPPPRGEEKRRLVSAPDPSDRHPEERD
ncbi:alpha/beta fold hydrolase [Caulobacter sp. CCG-8]|uniref:alpha/beta hydrolase family protein n=1 Tax=Caulobacter sp. CCG-8 TaxID=3127958 RepID=UPI00307D0292